MCDTTKQRRMILLLAAWVVCALPGLARADEPARGATTQPAKRPMRAYPNASRYYIIHTDLDLDTVRETAARLDAMAEEYHRRTKGFSGVIRRKFAFYLFSDPVDYYRHGGVPGSAGLFSGDKLMAIASKERGGAVWYTVQHEGFHQFAHKVVTHRLPVWVDEGLAEYFGTGIWTGDNFVTGVIPPARMKRVQALVKSGRLMAFDNMLEMDRATWNAMLSGTNYTQAWSMVYFLVHADNGKYQGVFSGWINDIAAGRSVKASFTQRFGDAVGAFQKRYSQWWLTLPENPTADLYTQAVVEILTSFLARAHLEGQQLETAEAFLSAAEKGELKMPEDRWLPPALLKEALVAAKRLKTWSLKVQSRKPVLALTLAGGKVFTGTFQTPKRGPLKVTVRKTEARAKGRTAKGKRRGE